MGKAFTLIEVLLAVFLIALGVLGAFALLGQTLAFTTLSADRLQASYLAQEGIEIVRNIRDSNWLEQVNDPSIPWSDGLGPGDWEADYDDQGLTSFGDRYLKINAGFYNYDSGTETKFKRKITITPNGADILEVQVLVSWQERGKSHQVSVQENLYNWKQ